ncbi:MAG: hypothetical protein ACKVQJ_05475 [Pyrinomonadaceae bacterium]
MNVFEDLVIELQEENLLEKTAINPGFERYGSGDDLDITHVPNRSYDLPTYDDAGKTGPVIETMQGDDQTHYDMPAPAFIAVEESEPDMSIHETVVPPPVEEKPQDRRPSNNREFFKKRAMGEVSSLQMVEHVVTGVEREYLKVVPKTFDDFNAKKALHTFLNADEGVNTEEHAAAEFTLMQETESWCTALARRDQGIPVSSLRQYCERSRPALSSQALLALGRFYRNLPYSEAVRSKFDFVITRLFSRSVGHEKRVCLFNREETLGHVNTLYSDWSSIPLYTADDDESKVMLTALSFDDLSIEAENASTFDQLLESDFFGRLRMFKESISELFYAPQVTAAAIDCNIRIGNAYVELIDRERLKQNSAAVQTKYIGVDDQTISEATGQTLQLVDLLRELSRPVEQVVSEPAETECPDENLGAETQFVSEPKVKEPKAKEKVKESEKPPFFQNLMANAFSVNRWFLAVAILLITASVGLYVWANFFVIEPVSNIGVKAFSVENSALKDHIKAARISGEIFYAQLLPSWDALPKEKRYEFLQAVFKAAQEKGCKQVNLIGKDGKIVGYASPTRLDVVMP